MSIKGFILLGICIFQGFAFQANAQAQGLAERRAIKEYESSKFPEFKKQISDAVGPEVKITVDWDKLAVAGQSEHYLEDDYLTNVFFAPLVDGLKRVTSDEMGKNALKGKLKEVVITFDSATLKAPEYKEGSKFENGVLMLNQEPWTNSGGPDTDYFKDRAKAIQQNLEEKL